jgi:hypothetical protein
MSRTYLPLGSLVLALLITTLAAADEAQFAKWSKIEFSFRGPDSRGGGTPNPFAVKLDVDFSGPGGRHFRVPGFYDGDGRLDIVNKPFVWQTPRGDLWLNQAAGKLVRSSLKGISQ